MGEKPCLPSLGLSFKFSLSAWLQTTRRCKSSFPTQGQHVFCIHSIFMLFAQSGSRAMFSALPSKTQQQKKAAGRLCTHFVRDCFHSQQRILEHYWETGLALPGPALPGSWLRLFVNLERVCCLCPREPARNRVLLCQHHLGNSEDLFLKVWWALCSAFLVLPTRAALMLFAQEGSKEAFSCVCICQWKKGNLLRKSGNNWIILCWGTIKLILKIIA